MDDHDTLKHPTFIFSAKLLVFATLILLLILSTSIDNSNHSFAQSFDNNASQVPPLRSSPADGTYIVEVVWLPKSFEVGNDTAFSIRIFDKSGAPILSKINYDFTIANSDLSPIQEFYNQTTDENGVGKVPPVRFEKPGPIEITVWINGPNLSGNSQSESATFDIVVAPEFSSTILSFGISGGIIIAVGILPIITYFRNRRMGKV